MLGGTEGEKTQASIAQKRKAVSDEVD